MEQRPTNLLALAVRKVRKQGGIRHDGDRGGLVFVSMLTWAVERDWKGEPEAPEVEVAARN